MGDTNMVMYSTVLCVTVALCYMNALDCGFVFDDVSAIIDNKDLRPRTPISNLFLNDFWGTPMSMEKSHKSYRPLCVLTFRMNYLFSQLEPMSYHLMNVVLHAVVCVLFMRVCRMFLTEVPSFLAALLFAVHPVHTEAVTGVVGRAEMLSSIFFLLALMVYSKCTGYHKPINWKPLFLSILMVSVAMLCKEQGITVIGVCVVYELFVAQKALFIDLWQILMNILFGKPEIPSWLKGSIIRSAVLVGTTVFLLFARIKVMGAQLPVFTKCAVLVGTTVFLLFARIKVMGAQLPVFTKFDNPASVSPTPARQMTYNYLLPINFWLLLFPAHLCCDWTMGTIPVIESLVDPRNLVTVGFYLFLAKLSHFALKKQGKLNQALLMSLALMVLPFIPASNLFFPVGFVVAERILYTPSMGFCMLIALGVQVVLQNKKSLKYVMWLFVTLLVITHSGKTFIRNMDWTSEYSLFRSALKVNHRNAKLWNNVGHALEKQNKFDEALEYFKKAVSVQPNDIGAHMNVGRTYKTLEQFDEAEAAYMRAKELFPPVIPGKSYTARVAPSHLNVFLNLASLYIRDPSRLEEANLLLKTATDMRPDYIQGYINRGDIMMKLGRPNEAIQLYELALKYEPSHADVLYNLGVVHMELKDKRTAFGYFEKALASDPEHRQSLYNTAVMIQEEKQRDLWPVALDRLNQLVQRNPNDSRTYFTLAMLAMDSMDYQKSEEYFKLAIQHEPTFKSALFNLALMMTNNMKKPVEAAEYVRKLLELYPDHIKGLMLLGELNANVFKNIDEAEQQYPDHIKGIMLLGELNVNVFKNLKEAEQNFHDVLKLEPGHIEAMHNLCVVYVERGDAIKGEKCLAHVHSLAPNEQYILNHLNIIRAKIKEAMDQQAKMKAAQQANQQSKANSENQQQNEKPSN